MLIEQDPQVLNKLAAIKDIKELNKELDDLECNYLQKVYSSKMLDFHILAKLTLTQYFELGMLLKRKNKLEGPWVDVAKEVLRLQKQCKFTELIHKLSELNIEDRSRKQDLVHSTRVYVLEKLSGLFTCYKLSLLADMLRLPQNETVVFLRELGYKHEDQWVILEPLVERDQTAATQKEVLKNKLVELTKLTCILEKNSK